MPNPFFDVVSEGPPSGTDALTTTQDVTSEPTTSATSESTTDAPGTSTSASTGPHTTTEATTSEPESVCGDGVHNGTEECDDGNQVDTDACLSSCVTAKCGDEIVWKGHENCDDGDGDACPADCKSATCGNGMVDPGSGEDCDDGNLENTDGCLVGCLPATCGDGFLHAGVEECDDANTDNTDTCTTDCLDAECGDGFVEADDEACDDDNGSNEDACTNVCKLAECGDGFTQGSEQCDDGPDNSKCDKDCKPVDNMCNANGIIDATEECDPLAAPYSKTPGLCKDDCKIESCFRVKNTANEEQIFAQNTWLDACAMTENSTVVVTLLQEKNMVVYMAKGLKKGDWDPDNLTAGLATPDLEYDVQKHTRLVPMDRIVPGGPPKDMLMLTSNIAEPMKENNICYRSLGDGYGVAVFAQPALSHKPKLLVMGVKGGVTESQRVFPNFDVTREVSYHDAGMDVCSDIKPFLGTFLLSVLP